MEGWLFLFFCAVGVFQLWWWLKAPESTKARLRAMKKGFERRAVNGAGKLAWWAIKRKW